MKRLVLRVPALLNEVFGRFVLEADLDQLRLGVGGVVLAKVNAQSTLPGLELKHGGSFPLVAAAARADTSRPAWQSL
jgi:hypothetical protein